PLFAFGHGLGYTTFELSDLAVDALTATVKLTNTGEVPGAEVVQLYTSKSDSKFDRPARELKAFAKVPLGAGESRTVALTIDRDDLAVWDESADGWCVEPGEYTVEIGTSSREIRLRGTVQVG
ncbi:MAG: fibronectin type III-like domain-contianing protein, partial [Planctomycetota bacterium]